MGSPSHELAFFREFLAKPLRVGALAPSGPALAAAIAAKIPAGATGPVLELGAGTGAVTAAILARVPVVAVEAEPGFAALLRRRFPQSVILQGNAFAFEDLLVSAGIADRFAAIVCGLPVIGHPAAQRLGLLRMALARLKPGAPFIQFCYASWPPYPAEPGVTVCHAETFWRNFPPMHIWTYARNP
ncbi:MAG: hypothetical protein WDN01_22285 [Rhizomicrobium sp.]